MLLHVLYYGRTPSDHVTDLLRDNLHWLRVPRRITNKLCLISYKALHNSMPDYITDFALVQQTTGCDHQRKIYFKYRGLPRSLATVRSVTGPTAWNSLPDYVKNASSLETFKSRLKTHLSKHSYDCR